MRNAVWLGVSALVAILAVEVTAGQTSAAKPPAGQSTPGKSAPASAGTKPTAAATKKASTPAAIVPVMSPSGVRFVGSVRDVMHILVEPNADKIFDSVAIDVNASGIHEQKPETDEQWDELEHAAIGLAEAVNLIKMIGRPMAQPGEMNTDPEGPELAPAVIAAKVNRTRAVWNKHANHLQDLAIKTLTVVAKKDAKALFDIGGDLDQACENCHLEYWYPDDKKNRK
jgi:hypothetical protein